MLNQIIEEAKSKETHSNDIESENKQPRNSPPRLRDHADSCMCRCRCGCVSNPINLSSQGFSAGSPLGDIESQIRLQIEERNRGKVEAESPKMSFSKGAEDINSRPLAQAKRTLIMENQDKIYENKNPMFALDRKSSRPAANERPAVRGSNIASTLANPSMRIDGHVIVDDMPTQQMQRERSRRRKTRKKLITNKANESRPQVEPHLTMSSNDIWREWIIRSPRLKCVFYSMYSANVDK